MNLNYRNTGKAKLMTLSDNGDGYLRVELRKNEERKRVFPALDAPMR